MPPFSQLDEERRLLTLLANGRPSKEIAQLMQCSKSSVERKIEITRAKFGAESRTHLVALAFARGKICAADIDETAD
jgi:DNA-binding CsgD family transcriptional regulator